MFVKVFAILAIVLEVSAPSVYVVIAFTSRVHLSSKMKSLIQEGQKKVLIGVFALKRCLVFG